MPSWGRFPSLPSPSLPFTIENLAKLEENPKMSCSAKLFTAIYISAAGELSALCDSLLSMTACLQIAGITTPPSM